MTRRRLARLIVVWQTRLGLERWKLETKWDEPCGEDFTAVIEKSPFYDTATLRLEAGWQKWSPEFAEVTVVHELLHLLHRDVDEAFRDLEGQLHRDAWLLSERRYKQAMEGFIDRTASRLVEIAGGS